MGIKERKRRHKEDFRLKILEAAKKLIVQEGIENMSIRKIAKEIEFSPTTIYLYYKDKKDIVYALHQEGFSLLRKRMEPLMHVENPFERLKAIGKIYLVFALDESGFYEVLFMIKDPIRYLNEWDENCVWEEGDRVFDFLMETIEDCKRAGYFNEIDTKVLSIQAWSTVHGIASLFISGHLMKIDQITDSTISREAFLESTFQLYIGLLERLK